MFSSFPSLLKMMAVRRGVEPLSPARQAGIISDIRTDHLAGPARFELATTVLETVMITISPRSYVEPHVGFEPALFAWKANVLAARH